MIAMNRQALLPSTLALLGLALACPRSAHAAVCTDGANPTYTKYNYLDGGLIVHVAKIDRGSSRDLENTFWPDHDWSFQIRPATCTGTKFGRSCDAARGLFTQYFYDQQNGDWKNDASGYFSASRSKCGLTGATTRDLWIDANSSAAKYACHLDNFNNHHLVEGEVSVSNANYVDERNALQTKLGNLLDQLPFSSTQNVPCYEPSNTTGLCGQDVLIYGLVASDNNHACGKPEIHPVHGVVTETAAPSYAGASYNVFMFGDYGKAAGYGFFGSNIPLVGNVLPIDKIGEYWVRDRPKWRIAGLATPYLEVDTSWVMASAAALAAQAKTSSDDALPCGFYTQPASCASTRTAGILEATTCTAALTLPVHDHGSVGSVDNGSSSADSTLAPQLLHQLNASNPSRSTTGTCPGVQYFGEYTYDNETVGGGQRASANEFVKGGFAAVSLKASWQVSQVGIAGEVKITGAGKGIAPGGAPDVYYYALQAQTHATAATLPSAAAALPPNTIDWCLPAAAIVAGEPPPPGSDHVLNEVDLPCAPGRAKGKASITFYVPGQAQMVPAPGHYYPGFGVHVGASVTFHGTTVPWERRALLIASKQGPVAVWPGQQFQPPQPGQYVNPGQQQQPGRVMPGTLPGRMPPGQLQPGQLQVTPGQLRPGM
jgi:hypothetical protein